MSGVLAQTLVLTVRVILRTPVFWLLPPLHLLPILFLQEGTWSIHQEGASFLTQALYASLVLSGWVLSVTVEPMVSGGGVPFGCHQPSVAPAVLSRARLGIALGGFACLLVGPLFVFAAALALRGPLISPTLGRFVVGLLLAWLASMAAYSWVVVLAARLSRPFVLALSLVIVLGGFLQGDRQFFPGNDWWWSVAFFPVGSLHLATEMSQGACGPWVLFGSLHVVGVLLLVMHAGPLHQGSGSRGHQELS